MKLQIFKLILEKVEEPKIKLPTSIGLLKKEEFHKNIYFSFIDYAEAFDCVAAAASKSLQSCPTLCGSQ